METATLLTLAGIVLGSQWLGQLLNKVYDNHINKKSDPMETIQKQIADTNEELKKLAKALDSNSELTMSHARERLNALCNKYQRMGYIPEREYVSFKLLGESYISAGGNHGFDTLFTHVISTLPTKDK